MKFNTYKLSEFAKGLLLYKQPKIIIKEGKSLNYYNNLIYKFEECNKTFSHTFVGNKIFILHDNYPRCMISCRISDFNTERITNWIDHTNERKEREKVMKCAEVYYHKCIESAKNKHFSSTKQFYRLVKKTYSKFRKERKE